MISEMLQQLEAFGPQMVDPSSRISPLVSSGYPKYSHTGDFKRFLGGYRVVPVLVVSRPRDIILRVSGSGVFFGVSLNGGLTAMFHTAVNSQVG